MNERSRIREKAPASPSDIIGKVEVFAVFDLAPEQIRHGIWILAVDRGDPVPNFGFLNEPALVFKELGAQLQGFGVVGTQDEQLIQGLMGLIALASINDLADLLDVKHSEPSADRAEALSAQSRQAALTMLKSLLFRWPKPKRLKTLILGQIRDLCREACACHREGRFEEGISKAESAVELSKEQLGQGHYSYPMTLIALGWLRHALGKNAESLFAEAAVKARGLRLDDFEHARVALDQIRTFYCEIGALTKVEELRGEVLDWHIEHFGPYHPRTAALGRVLRGANPQ